MIVRDGEWRLCGSRPSSGLLCISLIKRCVRVSVYVFTCASTNYYICMRVASVWESAELRPALNKVDKEMCTYVCVCVYVCKHKLINDACGFVYVCVYKNVIDAC
jgi:hypothetical protein